MENNGSVAIEFKLSRDVSAITYHNHSQLTNELEGLVVKYPDIAKLYRFISHSFTIAFKLNLLHVSSSLLVSHFQLIEILNFQKYSVLQIN